MLFLLHNNKVKLHIWSTSCENTPGTITENRLRFSLLGAVLEAMHNFHAKQTLKMLILKITYKLGDVYLQFAVLVLMFTSWFQGKLRNSCICIS
jgi:hypothetical protein